MRFLGVFFVTLGLVMFAVGCENSNAEKQDLGKASNFKLKDLNGAAFQLSDHSGKIILVNFFATWCPPCRMEMPDFNEIGEEYKDSVKIIAVNVGRENASAVKDFVKQNGLTFTVAMDDGKASSLYGPIRAIPVTVIIDKDFNVARKYVGMRTKDVFVKDIKALLNE